MISYVWVGIIFISCFTACCLGRTEQLASAIPQGTELAVSLCLTMVGLMGLWSGVMELMERSGIADKIAVLLRPVLSRLFPSAEPSALSSISANVTANMLGLSNAATPFGLSALEKLYAQQGESAELLRFVVLNSASIQIVPTTVAAVRASLGAESPFDIMPAVWGASAISVAAGLLTCYVLEKIFGGSTR